MSNNRIYTASNHIFDNDYSDVVNILAPEGKTLNILGNSGANPAGADTQIQYNDNGIFGASPNFTISPTGLTLLNNFKLGNSFIFVNDVNGFPSAVNGVIILQSQYTYVLVNNVNLFGSRIVMGISSTILSFDVLANSQTPIQLLSTGLSSSSPLITGASTYGLVNITLNHSYPLKQNQTATSIYLERINIPSGIQTQSIDINGVISFEMRDCYITNPSSHNAGIPMFLFKGLIVRFLIRDSFLTSDSVLKFDNTVNLLNEVVISGTTFGGSTGYSIDFSTSAIVQAESYIVKNCSLNVILGIQSNDNKAVFLGNRGPIQDSFTGGSYYMPDANNTPVLPNTWVKALGTTILSTNNQRVSHSNNKIIYLGTTQKIFTVNYTMIIKALSGDVLNGAVSLNGAGIITETITGGVYNSSYLTLSGSFLIKMVLNDYIELYVRNNNSNTITINTLVLSMF